MSESKTIGNGGPAFPGTQQMKIVHCATGEVTHEPFWNPGMTLRDWFAGCALQGFCANPAVFQANDHNGWSLANATEGQLVAYAYDLADRMLYESIEKDQDDEQN